MSEVIGLDEFLDSEREQSGALLAIVEADPNDASVVRVSQWSESRGDCGCAQVIPKKIIEGVRKTDHRVGGLQVVELILKKGATVPATDLFSRSHTDAPKLAARPLFGGLLDFTTTSASMGGWIRSAIPRSTSVASMISV